MFSAFFQWQALENEEYHENLHWDHAVLLTGQDLTSQDLKNGEISSKIVGLSPVSGMCQTDTSCTVSEGSHFESVFVIAHELGHSLGMKHDGRQDGNQCDPGSYLMSPTLGNGKNTWSTCSRQYLTQFLTSSQASCLKTPNGFLLGKKELLSKENMLLPGELFDADVQCKLQFGPQSRHSSQQNGQDVCTDLHCIKDHYTWASHSALEGTHCGLGKV